MLRRLPSRRGLPCLLWAASALLIGACSGPEPPPKDTDGESYRSARVIPSGLEVEDSLDVAKGDAADWKVVTAPRSGVAKLYVIVGDPFERDHQLEGSVRVFTFDAEPITDVAITPGEPKYPLEWPAEEGAKYYIKFGAERGAATYVATFEVDDIEEPADPCAEVECGAAERCEAGECVPTTPVRGCDPPCEEGERCDGDKCVEAPVEACPGGCQRGQYCHKRRNTCVPDPCFGVDCPTGQRCRGGQCTGPRVCDPKCEEGFKCVRGVCKRQGPVSLSAIVVSKMPQGPKTVLVLNRGKDRGVKVGHKGKVGGVAFVVTQVYATRCKALASQPINAVNSSRARIFVD